MDKYYSVIYLSASDLFEVFSRNKFDYQPEDDMKGYVPGYIPGLRSADHR